MVDEQQFSLSWNNFNSHLTAGCHESLCRGDLVDVTLAAEGQFVKAHRLVLSVCSPYFCKIFTQMPLTANQHAYVFLKDVSHATLKDLIQFMYCGEVNVKQEMLPAFISTAEALQIKGFTECSKPPDQSPEELSVPIQQNNTITQQTQDVQTLNQQQHAAAPTISTGTTTTTTALTHKRSSVDGGPHIKRQKSTKYPEIEKTTNGSGTAGMEKMKVPTAAPDLSKSQQTNETENADLIMEVWVKEEDGDADGGDNDGTVYIENDENNFTKNEDGTTAVSSGTTDDETTATTSFFDSSYTKAGDHNNSDAHAQSSLSSDLKKFILTDKGGILLVHQNHIYRSNRMFFGKNYERKYWRCIGYQTSRCRSRLKTIGENIFMTNREHNHSVNESRIQKARENNSIIYQSLSEIRKTFLGNIT